MKNAQKNAFILSSALLVFLLGSLMFLYQATYRNNATAAQGAEEWRSEIKRREDLTNLENTLKKLFPEVEELNTHFAHEGDIVAFLDTLEELGPQAGATIKINSVDNLLEAGGLTVGLEANGSFSAVYKFLKLLENSPYELNFIFMDMHKGEGKGAWKGVFKIQLLTFLPK